MAASLPFVALAFLSKETAVVLPPLLNWAGLWVPPDPSAAVSRPKAILRELLPWCVAALYMLTRMAILGSFGATYNNASYFATFRDGRFLHHFSQSLLQLVAPLNAVSAASHGIPGAALRAVTLVAAPPSSRPA